MPRWKYEWTAAKFERYQKERRGQGSGTEYKPWLTVQDVPSKGRVSRSPGWKTGRVHHFFSDLERRFFYVFEWSDVVTDIREQFPLLNLDLAVSIADEMGIRYPTGSQNVVPYVLTTDFMLSVKQGDRVTEIARTVKPSKELENGRVAEKFELERRYYEAEGIDWGIVTEQEIPEVLVKNIEWVHSAYRLEESNGKDIEELNGIVRTLKSRLQQRTTTVRKVTQNLDREMNLESGTSLYLFKHLIARKEIVVDLLAKKVSRDLPTEEISIRFTE